MTEVVTTISIPQNSNYGDKPWVARLLGRDKKNKYEREFCSSTTASTGLFEATARGKKATERNYYLVVRDDKAGLIRLNIGDETLALVLDRYGVEQIDKMIPYLDEEGEWKIRRADQTILLRTSRDELLTERNRLQARIAELDAELGAS